MDCFVTCVPDATSVCATEIKELIGKVATPITGACLCKDVSAKDLATLSYRAQSAFRVGVLLAHAPCEELTEKNILGFVDKHIDKKLLVDFFKAESSFAVEVHKLAKTPLPSTDMAALFGDGISEVLEKENIDYKVSLSHPKRKIFVQTDGKSVLIGLDLIGFSLGKRPYKMFIHPSSISGVLAYTVARLGGVKKNSLVLDPFCGSGTFPIEIALFQEATSCFHYEDKFLGLQQPEFASEFQKISEDLRSKEVAKKQNIFGFDHMLKLIKGAQKNAKIAGVLNATNFSKVGLDWVDAKFDEKSVDCIVGNPPAISKRIGNEKDVNKLFDELFYQARYLLKPKGLVTLLIGQESKLVETAQKHGFEVKEQLPIHSGKLALSVFIFRRKV